MREDEEERPCVPDQTPEHLKLPPYDSDNDCINDYDNTSEIDRMVHVVNLILHENNNRPSFRNKKASKRGVYGLVGDDQDLGIWGPYLEDIYRNSHLHPALIPDARPKLASDEGYTSSILPKWDVLKPIDMEVEDNEEEKPEIEAEGLPEGGVEEGAEIKLDDEEEPEVDALVEAEAETENETETETETEIKRDVCVVKSHFEIDYSTQLPSTSTSPSTSQGSEVDSGYSRLSTVLRFGSIDGRINKRGWISLPSFKSYKRKNKKGDGTGEHESSTSHSNAPLFDDNYYYRKSSLRSTYKALMIIDDPDHIPLAPKRTPPPRCDPVIVQDSNQNEPEMEMVVDEQPSTNDVALAGIKNDHSYRQYRTDHEYEDEEVAEGDEVEPYEPTEDGDDTGKEDDEDGDDRERENYDGRSRSYEDEEDEDENKDYRARARNRLAYRSESSGSSCSSDYPIEGRPYNYQRKNREDEESSSSSQGNQYGDEVDEESEQSFAELDLSSGDGSATTEMRQGEEEEEEEEEEDEEDEEEETDKSHPSGSQCYFSEQSTSAGTYADSFSRKIQQENEDEDMRAAESLEYDMNEEADGPAEEDTYEQSKPNWRNTKPSNSRENVSVTHTFDDFRSSNSQNERFEERENVAEDDDEIVIEEFDPGLVIETTTDNDEFNPFEAAEASSCSDPRNFSICEEEWLDSRDSDGSEPSRMNGIYREPASENNQDEDDSMYELRVYHDDVRLERVSRKNGQSSDDEDEETDEREEQPPGHINRSLVVNDDDEEIDVVSIDNNVSGHVSPESPVSQSSCAATDELYFEEGQEPIENFVSEEVEYIEDSTLSDKSKMDDNSGMEHNGNELPGTSGRWTGENGKIRG